MSKVVFICIYLIGILSGMILSRIINNIIELCVM